MTSPLDRSLVIALPWLIGGLAVAPFGLLLGEPGAEPMVRLVAHLAVLVLIGLVLADRLAALLRRDGWFSGAEWSWQRRRFSAAVVLVVVPTGVVALITLASAAALRFDASLQFLQLLSALDIVWAGAALYYGVWLIWGTGAARIAAALVGLVCIWSLANYVRVVGFTDAGGWLVDGTSS